MTFWTQPLRLSYSLSLLITCALLLGCPDDEAPAADTSADTGQVDLRDNDGRNVDATTDDDMAVSAQCQLNGGMPLGENLRTEGSDWGDCVARVCTNEGAGYNVRLSNFSQDGLEGTIDGDPHEFTDESEGPDIDIISVQGPGRTMLETIVVPAPGSPMWPTIRTHPGTGTWWTFADSAYFGGTSARSVLAMPTVLEIPLNIIISDTNNFSGSPFVGGDDYGYRVYFRTSPWNPTDLGSLAAGGDNQITRTGTLLCGGDIHYYTFTAPGSAPPTITLTHNHGTNFSAMLIGHKTIGGDLTWEGFIIDLQNTGTIVLPSTAHRPCDACSNTEVEYVVAVTDSGGAPGPFDYEFVIQGQ